MPLQKQSDLKINKVLQKLNKKGVQFMEKNKTQLILRRKKQFDYLHSWYISGSRMRLKQSLQILSSFENPLKSREPLQDSSIGSDMAALIRSLRISETSAASQKWYRFNEAMMMMSVNVFVDNMDAICKKCISMSKACWSL